MAYRNIKGITIEIEGNTTKLVKAIETATKSLSRTQTALKDVNRLLKLDPGNVTLLKQKQDMLRGAIENTKAKLEQEKTALAQLKEADKTANVTQEMQTLERQIADDEQQLKSLEKELKQFGSVAKQQIMAAGDNMVNFGNKITAASDKVFAAGRSMTTHVTAPIVGIGGAAVKATADFDTSMSKVRAIAQTSGEEFDALRDRAREMGETTKYTAAESADAMTYMAMAGWKADDMMQGIPGIMNLAAASGVDLARTSDIVTDALTAFGMSAEESGHFADVLAAASTNANTNVDMMGESFKYAAPVAGALGYSVEDTSLALGLMANSGIKASQAGTTLRTLFTNMAKPTEEMYSAMLKLGVSLDDGEGNMLSFRQVMDQLRSGFGQLMIPQEEFERRMNELDAAFEAGEMSEKAYNNATEDLMTAAYGAEGAEKAKYAAMLAGKRGMSGLLAIVNATEEDYNKLTNAVDTASDTFVETADGSIMTMSEALASGQEVINEYSGAAEAMAAVMLNNLGGDVTILKSKLGELAITVGDSLMPTLRNFVAKAQEIVDKLINMDDGTRNMILTIAGVVAAAGPVLMVIGGIGKGIGTLVTGAGMLVKGIGLLMSPMGTVIAIAGALVAAGVFVYKNWDTICEWANKVKEVVTKAWQNLKDGVVRTVENLRLSITKTWTSIKDGVTNTVQSIKDGITEKWNAMKTGVTNTVEGIKTSVSDKWNSIKEKVGSVSDSIKSSVSEKWNATKQVMGSVLENARGNVMMKLSQIKEAYIQNGGGIKGAVSAAMEGVKQYWSTGMNVLNTITGGKLNDLRNKFSSILENVRSVVSNAVERIKSIFNFSWSLPHIALPHFSISGSFSLSPPSIPHISVSWYKKAYDNPVMFTRPTVLPTAGGMKGFGDGNGAEVVLGMNKLKEIAGNTVTNNFTINAAPGMDAEDIADAVADRIEFSVQKKQAVWA